MKTLSLSLLALALSTPAFACPTLSGSFTQRLGDSSNTTITVILGTKVENGVYHYSLGEDSPFLPANGQPIKIEQDGQSGEVTMSCSGNSVTGVASSGGRSLGSVTYTLVDASTLVIQGTGEMAVLNGTFKK